MLCVRARVGCNFNSPIKEVIIGYHKSGCKVNHGDINLHFQKDLSKGENEGLTPEGRPNPATNLYDPTMLFHRKPQNVDFFLHEFVLTCRGSGTHALLKITDLQKSQKKKFRF